MTSDPVNDATGEAPGTAAVPTGDPAAPALSGPASSARAGDKLGRYTVTGKLGEGGMGVVLSAYDPDLDRRVALKLLRRDAFCSVGRERLLREARAMARLSHDNVVTVHEVGTVDEQIFVAMEYVDGGTLTSWCKRPGRSWQAIVTMFTRAGRGLVAAHDAGLVHRDFKADNVLVASDDRVLVTDFGIVGTTAVALGEAAIELSDAALTLTKDGSVVGTPYYMAPEQHRSEHLDARADQFSFAAALFWALYGVRPYQGDSYPELVDNVCDGALVAVPTSNDVPASVHAVLVRALNPDRDQRWSSMNALLGALAEAMTPPPRKHMAATIAIGVAIVVALGVAMVLGRSGAPATKCTGATERVAELWNDDAKASLRRAFTATTLPNANPAHERTAALIDDYTHTWVTMRKQMCRSSPADTLDLRMSCLDRRLGELAALLTVLADADAELVKRAVKAVAELTPLATCADLASLTAAIPLPEDPATRHRVDALQVRFDAIKANLVAGRIAAALSLAEAARAEAEVIAYPRSTATALHLLGQAQNAAGDASAAETSLRTALTLAATAKDDELVAATWIRIIYIVGYAQARYDEALAMRAGTEAALDRLGANKLIRARYLNGVATVLYRKGEYAEARDLAGQAVAIIDQRLGKMHHLSVRPLLTLGAALWALADYAAARAASERAVAISEKLLGADHLDVGYALTNLAGVHQLEGNYRRALELNQRALEIFTNNLGAEHASVGLALANLAKLSKTLGELAAARAYAERALTISERTAGADHPDTAAAHYTLATILESLGDRAAASSHMERSLAMIEARLGPAHVQATFPLIGLADIAAASGDHEGARALYARAVALVEKAHGPEHPYFAIATTGLGDAIANLGRPCVGRDVLERAQAINRKQQPDPRQRAQTEFALARALRACAGESERALSLAASARAGFAEAGAPATDELAAVDAWLAKRARR